MLQGCVYGYGLMITIVLWQLMQQLYIEQEKNKSKLIFSLTFYALLGGFTGAKLLFWITHIKVFMNNPKVLLLQYIQIQVPCYRLSN